MLDLLSPRRRQSVIQTLQHEPARRVQASSHGVRMEFWILTQPMLTGERIGYRAVIEHRPFQGAALTIGDAVQYIEAEVSKRTRP